ncbi:uncharacterized protein [Bemisia tabaci]
MRELMSVTSGVVQGESLACGDAENGSDVSAPALSLAATPGYLELTSEQAARLVCTEPIEKYYDVEEEPFARGKYATVRRCRERRTGAVYAAKYLRKRRSADLRHEILHEVAVLDSCRNCTRIVKLHQVFESSQDMILLLELAHGGELQTLLDHDEVPTEPHAARIIKQVLEALIYLHSLNVAHLDIKPQNLVLTGEYPDCDTKLCDFGISRYVGHGANVREILGTPDYVAPEVLNYEPISLATDMWSVGVLMYVLLTGCSPFGGDTKQETFCNIAQSKLDFPDDLFEDISDCAKDLMRKLMVKNPSNRLTAKECLQHKWFVEYLSSQSDSFQPKTAIPAKRSIIRNSLTNSSNSSGNSCRSFNCTSSSLSVSTENCLDKTQNPKLGLNINEINGSVTDAPSSKVNLDNDKQSETDEHKTTLSSSVVNEINGNSKSSDGENMEKSSNCDKPNTQGISNERRRLFMKNMDHLVRRLECDNDDITKIKSKASPDRSKKDGNYSDLETKTCISVNKPKQSSTNDNSVFMKMNTRCDSHNYRLPRTASSMQSMPVSGVPIFGYKFDNGFLSKIGSNFNIYNDFDSDSDSEASFKFRRVYILDECSDAPSPPLSLHGSLSSNDNSSISDSSSDTVSEMSIDSSSDRSSIISLDDSIDLGVYGKSLNQNRYASCCNVWEAVHSQGGGRVWPRECSGSFERALSRFATMSKSTENLRELSFQPHRKLTFFNNDAKNNSNSRKCIGLELMRERNGNVVIIREIKAISGSKYSRCSEVKCESVQSRIRRLQIQNGVRTELAKNGQNHFLLEKY